MKKPLLALSLLVLLAACGGSDDDEPNNQSSSAPGTVPRGQIVGSPEFMSNLSSLGLLQQMNAQIRALGGTPVCDIAIYRIRYNTVGGANEATQASTALMVPTGSSSECSGQRPIILYAHGTNTNRAFNVGNLQDSENAEGLLMAAFFATRGYIIVAPNYAGFDTSTLAYHPYLVAEQQAKDMIDALAAARSALPVATVPGTRDSGKLFITGYSQGGYVAMATHREMQAAGMSVTASAPMSGPYAIAAFTDAVFYGRVNSSSTISFTMMTTAYQKSYSNIYSSTADVFETQYATGIDSLLPSTTSRGDLYAQGKLPKDALFSSTPPEPSRASITPATTPTNLAPTFALGFGAGNLVKNSYRLSYLQDADANPDGGWPNTTTGVTAASPTLPLRQALKRNDLRNWVPNTPVLLCGGNADPSVFWMNTQLMQGYWTAQGAPANRFTVLDVDSTATTGDAYASLKGDFASAKQVIAAAAVAQGANDGGARAVADAYHTTLVAPFCLAAVKSFFAGL